MKKTSDTRTKIIDYLNYRGHHAWGNQTFSKRGRTLPKASRGVADIICCLRPLGRHLEIEIKTDKDKPSEAQLKHQSEILRCHGSYWFVKNFEDFLEQFSLSTL